MVNEAAPQRETVEPNESVESLSSSHEQVELEGLARDIACPNCEYNLRGILGDPVVCPECGNAFSVSKLLELRWNKPWHKAPKFMLAKGPVIGFFGGLVAMCGLAAVGQQSGATGGLSVLLLAVWILLVIAGFFLTQRVLPGITGVVAGFLSLVALVGYFGAVVLLLYAFFAFLDNSGTSQAGVGAIALAAAIGCGVIGRRSEKWIAAQCIKAYLRRKTSPRD